MASRPLRLTLLAVHLAVAAVFIGLIVHGIVVSLGDEMGWHEAESARCGALSPKACSARLADLHRQLDDRLAEIERIGGTQAERLWDEWSVGWRRELALAAGECCLSGGAPPEGFRHLALAERDLRDLEALYTTHVVQYAREIGAKAEAVDRDLGVTEKAPSSSEPPPRNTPARP